MSRLQNMLWSFFVVSFIVFGRSADIVVAASLTFSKVVNDLTPMQGVPGMNFFLYPTPPALDSGKVIFASQTSQGRALWKATTHGKALAKLVDSNTSIPDETNHFGDVFPFRVQKGRVVFRGNDDNQQAGYYSKPPRSGGTITRLVNQNTEIPEGGVNTFGAPGLSNNFNLGKGSVLFQGNFGGGPKIFAVPAKGGVVTPVNHLNIAICESGAFLGLWGLFLAPNASGDTVAVLVGDAVSNAAIYTMPLSGLVGVPDACASPALMATNATRIASHNVPVPDNGRNFDALGFGAPLIDDVVVFLGSARNTGTGQIDLQCIYSSIGGVLTKLVDTNTAVPYGTGNFQLGNLGPYTLSKGNVVFRGADVNGDTGLYYVKNYGRSDRKDSPEE